MLRFVVLFFCTFFCYEISFCQVNNESFDRLYAYANDSFNKGCYKKAVNLFKKLNEQCQFSIHEEVILLKLADAYFELGQYFDSISIYERLEERFLRSEFLPYILYKKAKAYLNQTRGLNNDQTFTKIALENYLKLVALFPENKYSCMASIDIDTCYKNLSGYEFYIGFFYYKNKQYSSAISRFDKLISSYPDNGYHYLALLYMTKCENLIHKKDFKK